MNDFIWDKQHEFYLVIAWDGTHFKTHHFEYPSFFVRVDENGDL